MEKEIKKGEIIIYKTPQGPQLDVILEKQMVWLTQSQMATLFGILRPAITKHLNNILKEKELEETSVCSILEHTAPDGKKYKTRFYNLDAIISVGYRVNSKRATQFRIWATKILKGYLVKGYAVNEKQLLTTKEKFNELQNAISFLQEKSKHELLAGQEKEILDLLSSYSKTLTLLEKYDTGSIAAMSGRKAKFILHSEDAEEIIINLKKELVEKKEASSFFGQPYGEKLEGIVKNLYQTFDRKELYPSLEDKAANLLYLIIKDHPFVDGNKRIASFLFIYFLDRNNYLYKDNGEKKINDNALVALALLIAVSDPREKDTMVKIITNLLQK